MTNAQGTDRLAGCHGIRRRDYAAHDCHYRSATSVVGRPDRPSLTSREREVLMAWLRTDSKAGAGRELFIASCTVSTHIERIRQKYIQVGRPAPTKSLLTIRAIQDDIICVCDLE